MSFSNKTVPITFIATIIAFGYLAITSGLGAIRLIICVAGGLCGSLFAFLTSPKVKAAKKNAGGTSGRSGGLLNRAEKAAYVAELDSQSPRNKKSSSSSSDDNDETTVVGTLKF